MAVGAVADKATALNAKANIRRKSFIVGTPWQHGFFDRKSTLLRHDAQERAMRKFNVWL